MACDAQTLINSAYSSGYAKLSERDLKMAIVAAACAGGGGGGSVACGTGAPTTAPSGTCGFYIQTDSAPNAGVIWEYFGGAWHQG